MDNPIYGCISCSYKTSDYEKAVKHVIFGHPTGEIKLRRYIGGKSSILSYKVIPELCREQGRTISINPSNQSIHISRANAVPKDSPYKKLCKLSNSLDDQDCDVVVGENVTSFETTENDCDSGAQQDVNGEYKELIALLPNVIETLRTENKLEEFILFNRLLSEKKFPLENIAFLLFLDVVRWFSLEGSSTQMRYSEKTKLFWRTGLQLFKGRFLRFMGGLKNKGQVVLKEVNMGSFTTKDSQINFIVPDRRCLDADEKFIENDEPGIIQKMIEKIVQNDQDQKSTYKVCVDGKKINPCSKGEVNLWGKEDKPTFDEKYARLSEEVGHHDTIKKTMEKLITTCRTSLSDMSEDEKGDTKDICKRSVLILSNRIKDMRQLRVKKSLFLEKMMSKCESDWKTSCYAMVISSIRTTIYQIEHCIADLLLLTDQFCEVAAVLSNVSHLRTGYGNTVDLNQQENLVCLNDGGDIDDPPQLKQRSPSWFSLRKQSLVTGSTINRAIGLEGLKTQKEFILESKNVTQSVRHISDDLQKKLDYGTRNEVNAVATFVSGFLPAFHSQEIFYEEGCYVIKDNTDEKIILVVSPDGSVRSKKNGTEATFGIEIKCPYPDKKFSTPVHYLVPARYVTQILSEMYSLRTQKLYFVSFSEESTAIHLANYDASLWEEVLAEVLMVDGNQIPKKLRPEISSLRTKIDSYRQNQVHLVAEIPSLKAIPCSHPNSNESRRSTHQRMDKNSNVPGNNLVSHLQKTADRAIDVLQKCHKLSAQRASEVLVFMVCDLDRFYKPEIPHAFPIAYGLKGYSMKSETMREMLKDVLQCLFHQGLYTPAVSYDGQWAKLAYQDDSGKPLTLLELQKKVFSDVKGRTVAQLTRQIFEIGALAGINIDNITDKLDVEVCLLNKSLTVGLRKPVRLLQTSRPIAEKLKGTKYQQTITPEKDKTAKTNTAVDIDSILSDMPSHVLSSLEDTDISSMQALSLGVDNVIVSTQSVGLEKILDIDTIPYGSALSDVHGDGDAETPNDVDIRTDTVQDTNASSDVREDVENLSDADTGSESSSIGDTSLTYKELLENLQSSGRMKNNSVVTFKQLLATPSGISSGLTKADIIACLHIIKQSVVNHQIHFCKSWKKEKLVECLNFATTAQWHMLQNENIPKTRRKTWNPDKLSNMCKKVVRCIPKGILNAIVSEYEMLEQIRLWRHDMPYISPTKIQGSTEEVEILWFSKPEYNPLTLSYIFGFLDIHHLITNCRTKVCKDGIQERGISKKAWVAVAKENKTNLKISHVEDLVDKQSDVIARETFSSDVESRMLHLGFIEEAAFCKLVREFYDAEDEPGLSSWERCQRRLRFRDWLLDGINFCSFPPYGSHIRGIPNVMFQGFLTNIERRLQIFPFVKSGTYNVRSLGSLEVENFFGQFQDLDQKGSGVIKAEEVPTALESACQLLKTRLQPDRPFHMAITHQSKVYPLHELLKECQMETDGIHMTPSCTDIIIPRDHVFDAKQRAKRKSRRRLATIADPDEAARGVGPVRQFHKCDESKILAHKRLGIDV